MAIHHAARCDKRFDFAARRRLLAMEFLAIHRRCGADDADGIVDGFSIIINRSMASGEVAWAIDYAAFCHAVS